MTTYSAEYLEGIKDGRATLKLDREHGIALAITAGRELAFCDRVAGCYGSALAADYLKGLRDFWRHALRKAELREK